MPVDADEEVEQWACGGGQAWPERRRCCTLYLASQGPIGGALQHAAWERPALECACGGVAALTRRASRASAAAGVWLGREQRILGSAGLHRSVLLASVHHKAFASNRLEPTWLLLLPGKAPMHSP
jgi:hypothetical protein